MAEWLQAAGVVGIGIGIGVGLSNGLSNVGWGLSNVGRATLDDLRQRPMVIQVGDGHGNKPIVLQLGGRGPPTYVKMYEAIFTKSRSAPIPAIDTDDALDFAKQNGAKAVKRCLYKDGVAKSCRILVVDGEDFLGTKHG